ncbi:hypothetical protein [Streptomyces poonensis]|uniref:hypothetical protein n=1 Tax=Streptomyces poonensis TaxID=68255 RepID=UPI00167866C0|nr:hypothetical protein [Streptomyces poonensis]
MAAVGVSSDGPLLRHVLLPRVGGRAADLYGEALTGVTEAALTDLDGVPRS